MTTTTPRLHLGRRLMSAPDPSPEPADPLNDHAGWADFLGGRVLAWLGAVATLLGIVLLLALAISHGWIGRPERVAMAAAASAVLMAAGMRLHARRGRTEAAIAMVGAATAGGFATLVVAGEIYRLIPPLAAVAGSILVGGLATALAVRWAGRAIAAIGLIGALLSPALVGAYNVSPAGARGAGAATIAILGIATACAIWVLMWRRWPVLGFAAMLVATPQWVLWLAAGHSTEVDLVVLTGFGALGLAAAVCAQIRNYDSDAIAVSAAALALVNAALVGVVARLALGATVSGIWLAGMGVAHVGVALWRRPRFAIHQTLRRLLIATGVIIADVALALLMHGPLLSAAWGAGAVSFAWLLRRTGRRSTDESWLGVALGEHIALVLVRAVIELPPVHITDPPELTSVIAVGLLAATCLVCARAAGPERRPWRMTLDGLGLVAIGYLTLATLDGAVLVAAWTAEAIALGELARRSMGVLGEVTDRAARAVDPISQYGSLAFLGAAEVYTLALIAPPNALVIGAASVGQATLALGVLTAGALRLGFAAPRASRLRRGLLSGGPITLLYLASVAIITTFQPALGSAPDTLLDLGVRQQGQVLLSALWGAVGVGALIVGLRLKIRWLRSAALALLLTTVAKVFLYDFATLTSLYRVISFFVLGGLLLAGAFAYQRFRPPPPPDLRSLHPSQR